LQVSHHIALMVPCKCCLFWNCKTDAAAAQL